jgi:hypothetical protein
MTVRQARLVLPLIATLLLAGCGMMTAFVATSDPCAQWLSITWSTKDTDQTIKEVKANNAAREAVCGKP